MGSDIAATARLLIQGAESHAAECAAWAASGRPHTSHWRHEAAAWLRYAERLRAIAARHTLPVPPRR